MSGQTTRHLAAAARPGHLSPFAVAAAGAGVALGVTVLTTVVLLATVLRVFSVASASMAPAIPQGSWIVVDRTGTVGRDGALIAFTSVGWSGTDAVFVKRVEGAAGDTVGCCALGGLARNGVRVDEPFVRVEPQPIPFPAVLVPAGRLWVEGDNRASSMDSRAHRNDPSDGTIAVQEVIGTVTYSGSTWGAHGYVVARAAAGGLLYGVVVCVLLAYRGRRSTRAAGAPDAGAAGGGEALRVGSTEGGKH